VDENVLVFLEDLLCAIVVTWGFQLFVFSTVEITKINKYTLLSPSNLGNWQVHL